MPLSDFAVWVNPQGVHPKQEGSSTRTQKDPGGYLWLSRSLLQLIKIKHPNRTEARRVRDIAVALAEISSSKHNPKWFAASYEEILEESLLSSKRFVSFGLKALENIGALKVRVCKITKNRQKPNEYSLLCVTEAERRSSPQGTTTEFTRVNYDRVHTCEREELKSKNKRLKQENTLDSKSVKSAASPRPTPQTETDSTSLGDGETETETVPPPPPASESFGGGHSAVSIDGTEKQTMKFTERELSTRNQVAQSETYKTFCQRMSSVYGVTYHPFSLETTLSAIERIDSAGLTPEVLAATLDNYLKDPVVRKNKRVHNIKAFSTMMLGFMPIEKKPLPPGASALDRLLNGETS